MLLATLVVATTALVVGVVALVRVHALTRLVLETAAARGEESDDVDWQLQWIEPGVFVLTNTSSEVAAFDVEVSSTLTPSAGGSVVGTVARASRVNPGAWVEVRHPGVGQSVFDDLQQLRRSTALTEELRRRPEPLDVTHLALLSSTGAGMDVLQERVEHTLAYAVSWRSSGVARRRMPPKQRLVPSPAA